MPLDKHFPKQMPRVSRITDFILQAHCAWLFCSSFHEAFEEMLRKTKLFSHCVGFQIRWTFEDCDQGPAQR